MAKTEVQYRVHWYKVGYLDKSHVSEWSTDKDESEALAYSLRERGFAVKLERKKA